MASSHNATVEKALWDIVQATDGHSDDNPPAVIVARLDKDGSYSIEGFGLIEDAKRLIELIKNEFRSSNEHFRDS